MWKREVYLSVWKNSKDVVMRSKIITTINCIGILKRPQNVTSSKTENAWWKCVLIFYSALKKMSSISITSINHRKKLSKSNSFSDKAFILKPAEGEIGSCTRKRQVSQGSQSHREPSMCMVLIRTLVSLHSHAQGFLTQPEKTKTLWSG